MTTGPLQPVELTIELATVATIALVIIATPLAWWLARSGAWWRRIAAVVSLPIVLPPTVIGFYLLVALGPHGPGGALAQLWGGDPRLHLRRPRRRLGRLFAAVCRTADSQRFRCDWRPAARSRRHFARFADARFFAVALPLASPGLLTGAVLGFAHTVGEFGVVLMIGGAIPGRTAVVSTTIFDYVETGEWGTANALAAGMVVFAFVVILAMIAIEKRFARGRP